MSAQPQSTLAAGGMRELTALAPALGGCQAVGKPWDTTPGEECSLRLRTQLELAWRSLGLQKVLAIGFLGSWASRHCCTGSNPGPRGKGGAPVGPTWRAFGLAWFALVVASAAEKPSMGDERAALLGKAFSTAPHGGS